MFVHFTCLLRFKFSHLFLFNIVFNLNNFICILYVVWIFVFDFVAAFVELFMGSSVSFIVFFICKLSSFVEDEYI